MLTELNFKCSGFFVDIGASNGFDYSNTYTLEKVFGWNGILAEPAKVWHNDLKKHRSSVIDNHCVWSESGATLNFRESFAHPDHSTLEPFVDADGFGIHRDGKNYDVETISLNDLLAKYQAPAHIDYLSIDTEGSEFPILDAFDFNKYRIDIITCEHNYKRDARQKIYDLLTSHGYVRKMEYISDYDDWYVKKDIAG